MGTNANQLKRKFALLQREREKARDRERERCGWQTEDVIRGKAKWENN